MRTATGIYRTLLAYLNAQDAAAPGGFDASVDPHFRSGIMLGMGLCVPLFLFFFAEDALVGRRSC